MKVLAYMEKDFSFYNNFPAAVLVLDSEERILFKNHAFLRTFSNVKNLEKFSNYFNFDICMLDSENIQKANPVSFALSSSEHYTAYTFYQRNNSLYFELTSFKDSDYRILIFKDITSSVLYEGLQKDYEKLSVQYSVIEEQSKNSAVFQQKAQNQAVKMALMHRISSVIRESIDLTKIINSALKELANLFGAAKAYFAAYDESEFVLKFAYPSKYKNCAGVKIELEERSIKEIHSKNICVNSCLKEYLNSETTFPSSMTRIIVPVYRMNRLLGILMIYTNNSTETQNDILQSIASQLASAIVQASLFQEVSKKNEELETTLKELKETQLQLINSEKMASLGQLVAGVAHEINTPLASISSNNDILSKLILRIEKCDEKLLSTFENINKIDKEAIKRINQIVQSLKKFVRLDESDLQEAEINREIDLTLELIHHETKNKIKIIKDYSELPKIKCYPNMLNQVFMNILINACQSIKTSGEITISTRYEDRTLLVRIKDNGEGIDDSLKSKIFNAGTTTKKIGTGLGLAISQKIIEKHQGEISFVSEKGKGTEFTIKIPDID